MSDREKASKFHCWPKESSAEAYEGGFLNGAGWAFDRGKAFLNADSLFLAIGHGDKEHQEWLRTELRRWFESKWYLADEAILSTPTHAARDSVVKK